MAQARRRKHPPTRWNSLRPQRPELIHIVALNTMMIAPLLQTLTGQVEFFLAHKSRPFDVFLLLGLLLMTIPLGWFLIASLLARLNQRLYRSFHLLTIASLSTLSFLPALKALPGIPAIFASVILGIMLAFFYHNGESARRWLTYMAVSTIIIPLLFLSQGYMPKFLFTTRSYSTPTTQNKSIHLTSAPPIVILLLDELPVSELMDAKGQIDEVRYPNFARLAKLSTWYPNTVTFTDETRLAIPGILTGNLSSNMGAPLLASYPQNLLAFLDGTYTSHIHEGLGAMSPQTVRSQYRSTPERLQSLAEDLPTIYLHCLLPPDFTQSLPPVNRSWRNFVLDYSVTEKRAQNFEAYLEKIKPTQSPGLYFYHLIMPHFPYRYLPSTKQYYGGNDSYITGLGPEGKRWSSDWMARQEFQRHSLQLGATDKLLGKLLDKLKETELLNSCLLAVMADHGCSFREGVEFRRMSPNNYPDILTVPLFIKAPWQRKGRIDPRPASLLDVTPTIVAYLGLDLPWKTLGIKLQNPPRSRSEIPLVFSSDGRQAALEVNPVTWWQTSLTRKLEVVGDGSWDRVYNLGPYKELYKQRANNLPTWQATGEVELPFSSLWANVRTSDNVLPCRIQGRLTKTAPAPIALAIEVNGQIEATTWASSENNGRFTAMVPESSLKNGPNTIKIFQVLGPEGGPLKLAKLPLAQDTPYTLHLGKNEISYKDKTFTLDHALDGDANMTEESEYYLISGWAGNTVARKPAERVLVFYDNQFIRAADVELNMRINGLKYGPSFLQSGFLLQIPKDALPKNELTRLKIYALSSQGTASQIHLSFARPTLHDGNP